MRSAAGLASGVAALAACLASATGFAADVPVWEREGLGGAVRPEMGSPQPGEAAPDFQLAATDGAKVRLRSLQGHWVVLHFTATWCPFCDAEVEHLGNLAKAYADRGVRTLIIDVKEDLPTWKAYAANHVSPMVTALRDASGEVARKYAPPRAQPSFKDRSGVVLDATIIVDPQGKIRLFLLPDSAHYDPTFRAVRRELDGFLAAASAPLLSPDEVVTATAAVGAPAQSGGEITVRLAIAAGYHVMSNAPSRPEYIATRIFFDAHPDVTFGEAVYPAARDFAFAGNTIKVFSEEAVVRIPFAIARVSRVAARTLHGRVKYQACTIATCLFPASKRISVELAGR